MIEAGGRQSGQRLWDVDVSVGLDDLLGGSCLHEPASALQGRSVLLAGHSQLAAALAMIELDGVARQLVICPPGLSADQLAAAAACVDVVVSDLPAAEIGLVDSKPLVSCGNAIKPSHCQGGNEEVTEWVLQTSGTSGVAKLVAHTLETLAGALQPGASGAERPVWSTFYDIRRFGGLQILLRSLIGGSSLVLSNARESLGAFLGRVASHGVTHISGTPSHWRRALMSPAARNITPKYIRLSGEIADQAILDGLRAGFGGAMVAHAFASTEAGVAFEVRDGQAGFPASLLGGEGTVEMKVEDGSLRIRSPRTGLRYLGEGGGEGGALADSDGFVDTGDMVEQRGERCYFVGRRGGVINVGGLKVHPEEVEAVINRHPQVRMSLVKARRSPITGAIVVADVVARERAGEGASIPAANQLKSEIILSCHRSLATYKVPAAIQFVTSLDVAVSGKLARPIG